MWDLTTTRDPRTTLMYALYLGLKEDQIGGLIQVSRRRRHEVKRGRSAKQAVLTRSVLSCFVFSSRSQVNAAKAVQRRPLCWAGEQALVGMLAVEVDETGAQIS